MKRDDYILVDYFCEVTNTNPEFLKQLYEHDLIKHIEYNKAPALLQNELPVIERMLRLHYDLNVNIEGLQVINHMREKMIGMQNELLQLKRKLKRFE